MLRASSPRAFNTHEDRTRLHIIMDTRTLIFFACTSAVLVLTFLSLVTPLVGLRRYSYLVYKLALLASVAAFGYRPVYSAARYIIIPAGCLGCLGFVARANPNGGVAAACRPVGVLPAVWLLWVRG